MARRKIRRPKFCKPVQVPCTGEAHSNPFIDHCMVCLSDEAPWGYITVEHTDPRAAQTFE